VLNCMEIGGYQVLIRLASKQISGVHDFAQPIQDQD
jgi:hypothetical protein